jgi:hypothetical protein
MNKALCQKEIVAVGGVKVGNAPFIAPDGDGVLQGGQVETAVCLRQMSFAQA